jgi:[acyl-carrier-protein] S-malonyltransferase
MKKIALIFPGQGSQTVGMGKDLYEKYPKAREIIDSAGDELKSIIFEGPEETLKITKYAQPAIFTVSSAAFEVFKENFDIGNIHICAAGHSLGEYCALYCAGFLDFKSALELVKARGQFIQNASDKNPGLMAAVLGLEKSVLEDVCKQASSFGVCEAVNYNCPGQIVISGNTNAVNKAVEIAKEKGALKTVVLNVSGPFHSSLMSSAADDMKTELQKYNFKKPSFGIWTNCDAQLTLDPDVLKEKLILQVKNPVKWDESIGNMIANGFEQFVEIGPGKVLSGLLRRIDRTKKTFNIEDSESLQKTLEEINK